MTPAGARMFLAMMFAVGSLALAVAVIVLTYGGVS